MPVNRNCVRYTERTKFMIAIWGTGPAAHQGFTKLKTWLGLDIADIDDNNTSPECVPTVWHSIKRH